MQKKYDKLFKFVIKILVVVGVIFAVYFLIKYFIPFFAPFVVAFIIAMINEPITRLFEKLKVPRKLASVISLFITICVLAVLVAIGIIALYNELISLQANVTSYSDTLTDWANQLTTYYKHLPKDISNAVKDGIVSFIPQAKSIAAGTVSYLIHTIKSVPSIAIFVIMTLLATYFISSDMKEIKAFLRKQIPAEWSERFEGLKADTFKALIGYFKALLMLMCFTFIEVLIGLSIMRIFVTNVDYIVVMALLVALSDAIPVLGTGIVMVPWISWHLITGNIPMAIGLLIIYVCGVVVRQTLEPKIVGDQIGLHPLATLIAIFLGLEIFGVLGFFLGPITFIVLKSIQKSGIIKIWNE